VRPRTTTAAAIFALAALLTACTTSTTGTPSVAPGPTTSSGHGASSSGGPGGNDTFGAPRVSVPLDAGRFLSQPCSVLSTAQLSRFNISKPGEPDTDSQVAKASGPGCSWKADGEPFRGLDVSFLTGNKKGLSDIYRGQKQNDQFAYFEETTVDGYPAVFADGTDGRSQGSCDIKVGISDALAFRAGELSGGSRGPASCDGAKELAAAVIATLKGGS
jgi:Protein of unknown function (DUF3558)